MKRIERVSVTDEVVENIRMLIAGDQYKVGQKLPTEFDFCEQLGVGRSTIREAFRVLQALGLIELRPGKGAFVSRKSMEEQDAIKEWFIENNAKVSEFMEVRMAIEPLAAKLAIIRSNPIQIEKIKGIHEAFCDAVYEKDVVRMATLDESFHNAIMEASNNRLMIKIGKLLANALMEYRTRSFAFQKNSEHAVIPHKRILDAIIKGDEKGAVSAILEHLEITLDDMNKATQ